VEYEVMEVAETTYAVIKRTVQFSELPQVMPGLVSQVHDWAHAQGSHGPAMCISSMAGEGKVNIAPGVQLDAPVDTPDPIEIVTKPGGRAAVYVHVGPYDELAQVYQRFYDALNAAGESEAGDPVEIYESAPDDPRPSTRIIWPIR
jgi:AraC family transcriptional regulator